MADNQKLIAQISKRAEKHLDESEDELLERSASLWVEVDAELNQIRPTQKEIKKFLDKVVKGVVKDVTKTHREITVITLTFATEQLVNYLIVTMGWSTLNPYAIPLELLAAIVYTRLLKEVSKTL
jgi:hypothetical protein